MMGFSTYQPSLSQHKANAVSVIPNTAPAAPPISHEISRIEAALLSLASIQDCIVLEQNTDFQTVQRLAYVVTTKPVTAQQLHQQLQRILPTTPLPTAYITVPVLPLTEQGQVDQTALHSREPSSWHPNQLSWDTQVYQKSWQHQPLTSKSELGKDGLTLIFTHQSGLGSDLCDQLEQLNQPYIQVEPGSNFACLSPNYYYLNPVNPYHYQQLLESITATGKPVTHIIHLWAYHPSFRTIPNEQALEYSLDLGVHSLWFLTQALTEIQGSTYRRPVRLLVATNHRDTVYPMTNRRHPEIRLLQTLSQVQPNLHCCCLDLPEQESTENAHRILQELSTLAVDSEVTYHQGQRWVAQVEPVQLTSA